MKISLELSMYPLNESYESQILEFIHHLHQHPALKVKVNALSTQVQGEWDDVFAALKVGVEAFFDGHKGAVVMKLLPGHIDLDYQYSKA